MISIKRNGIVGCGLQHTIMRMHLQKGTQQHLHTQISFPFFLSICTHQHILQGKEEKAYLQRQKQIKKTLTMLGPQL